MVCGADGPRSRGSSTQVQEVLDDAVRRLAVSADDLWERLVTANLTLGRLSREDFPAGPDQRLLDRIRGRMMRMDLAEHESRSLRPTYIDVSDAALEATAEAVLRLRDRTLLRSLL